MTDYATPKVQDVLSVGSRINFGAVFAGGLVALAIHLMLATLGAAVGLSVSDNVKSSNLQTASVAWGIMTLCVSLFVGGLMTSLFTVGENRTEAVFYGVIMWAFLFAAFLMMGAAGSRGAFTGVVGMAQMSHSSRSSWDSNAREAGVPQEVIDNWMRTAAAKVEDPASRADMKDAATRWAWIAFGGTWVSMLAAAAGSWIGAGPTFRIVPMAGTNRVVRP